MAHRTPAKDRKRQQKQLAQRSGKTTTTRKQTNDFVNRAIAGSSVGQVVSARPIDELAEIYWVIVGCDRCAESHRYTVRPRSRWHDRRVTCDASGKTYVRFRFSASTLSELAANNGKD